MQRRILNALSKEILSGRIQKNAIVGMMMNESDTPTGRAGQEDTSGSAGRFHNLDKVAPVLE